MERETTAELGSMFDNLSLSRIVTLPERAHRFTINLFKSREHVVPPAEWFHTVIPPEDPTGVTLFALARLEERATGRVRGPGLYEDAPLAVYLRAMLIQGTFGHCADHLTTMLDQPLGGCDVCEWREEWLLKGAENDKYHVEWLERNRMSSRSGIANFGPCAVDHLPEERLRGTDATLDMDMEEICWRMANV